MPLVSAEHVENQSFVCIGKANISIASSIREVQLALQGFKGHSRLFCHGLDVHGFVWLKANDKLVPTTLPAKNVPGNIAELDTNLSLSLVQSCEQHSNFLHQLSLYIATTFKKGALVHNCTAMVLYMVKGRQILISYDTYGTFFIPFPHFRMKGTPSHRSFLMRSTAMA